MIPARQYGTRALPEPTSRGAGPLRAAFAAWLGALAILFAALAPTPALADPAPSDVGGGWTADGVPGLRLPDPPSDYVTERRGDVEWTYPAAAAAEARDLQQLHRGAWDRIVADLGRDLDDGLVVRIGRNPEEMRALAPQGIPPPAYASGVAYPRFGVVLLTLTAPETWERPDMAAVYTHELSHIALHRAVEGHPVPRWFTEGLAVFQAGEASLERHRTLWTATVTDGLLSLDELSGRFPNRPHQVNVAYAASADMVRFLRSAHGTDPFRELIVKLSRGLSFEEAVLESFDASLGYLEREWRDELDERYRAMPLILSGAGVWALASLLIVLAWIRKKRKERTKLRRWAKEEAAEDEAFARAEQAVIAEIEARDTAPWEPSPTEQRLLAETDPQRPETEIPTIEVDGRSHTLH